MAGGVALNGQVGDAQRDITDEQAKTIGRLWAAGDPHMERFAQTGAISDELIESLITDARMLDAAVADEETPPVVARAQVRALLAYVRRHGHRGPVLDWQRLAQTDPVRGIIEPIVTENFQHAQRRHEQRLAAASTGGSGPLSLGSGPRPGASIYVQLGAPAIADVVVTFYKMMMADPSLAPYFEGYDVEEIMAHQHQFLCVATGGPLSYLGRSIRGAHEHLKIANEHFDRTAEHLQTALAGAGVPGEMTATILAKVEAFRAHVVADG